MEILCLTGWFPYPPDNGARIRLYHLLCSLGLRHRLDLISFLREDEQVKPEALGPSCRLLGAVPFQITPRSAGSGLLSRYPRSLEEQYNPAMATLVRQAIAGRRYDLVLACEIGPGVSTAPYLWEMDSLPRVIEDLEVSMILAKAQAQRAAPARWRQRLTWWKQRRYTAELLHRVNGCTVASEAERRAVLDIVPGYRPLAVVPNGVDMERYRGDFGPVEPDTLVFPGALTYEANFEAMRFFLSEVLPLVRATRPRVTLRITGRSDGVPLDRLPLGENVVLTGYLADVRPAIARSSVCVVPMTLGGGTRLKILEAMALGTPVVATSKGAEGLEVTSGEDILIADTPEEFAAQTLRLLEDPELRARLADNARRLVSLRYGWPASAARLEALLQEVVAEHGK